MINSATLLTPSVQRPTWPRAERDNQRHFGNFEGAWTHLARMDHDKWRHFGNFDGAKTNLTGVGGWEHERHFGNFGGANNHLARGER